MLTTIMTAAPTLLVAAPIATKLVQSPWVEYAKVIGPLLTPIVVVIVGFFIQRTIAKYVARATLDHAIIDKRAEIYSTVEFGLNDIYCYIKRVGNWKEKTPADIIEAKRAIDRIMYASKPYWSTELFNCYRDFMYTCFDTYRGTNKDAGIIAEQNKYKSLKTWRGSFSSFYAPGFDEDKLDKNFARLEWAFSLDFGIEG